MGRVVQDTKDKKHGGKKAKEDPIRAIPPKPSATHPSQSKSEKFLKLSVRGSLLKFWYIFLT